MSVGWLPLASKVDLGVTITRNGVFFVDVNVRVLRVGAHRTVLGLDVVGINLFFAVESGVRKRAFVSSIFPSDARSGAC